MSDLKKGGLNNPYKRKHKYFTSIILVTSAANGLAHDAIVLKSGLIYSLKRAALASEYIKRVSRIFREARGSTIFFRGLFLTLNLIS